MKSAKWLPRTSILPPITHVIHFALVPDSDGSIDSSANSLTPSACAHFGRIGPRRRKKGAGLRRRRRHGDRFLERHLVGQSRPFVTNIVKFMSDNGYDGVDLDWEPFNSSDTAQYTNLVNACARRSTVLPRTKC
jgi:hypothetical protein